MKKRLCRITVLGFAALFALALLAYGAGTFGWAGAEKDPLSGVFLILLGQPWVLLISQLPESVLPAVPALAPSVNMFIILLICHRSGNRGN